MHNNRKNKRRSQRGNGGKPAFPRELTDLAARMAARRMPLPRLPCGKPMSFRVAETHGWQIDL